MKWSVYEVMAFLQEQLYLRKGGSTDLDVTTKTNAGLYQSVVTAGESIDQTTNLESGIHGLVRFASAFGGQTCT